MNEKYVEKQSINIQDEWIEFLKKIQLIQQRWCKIFWEFAMNKYICDGDIRQRMPKRKMAF